MHDRRGRLVYFVVTGALLAGCASPSPSTTPTQATDTGSWAAVCADPVLSPLPEWARTGFNPPDQPVAQIWAEQGSIVAVPFGWPLRPQQPAGRQNKVLWIAKEGRGGPMKIAAQLDGAGGEVVYRELPDGPGPSTVDLPTPGCWRLDLSWPGGQDRIYLRYFGPAT